MPIKGASVDRTPERPVLALDEVFRLAAVIEHRYRAMVLLAVFGSLRHGELPGLTRADLDLSGARLHVRRAVAEVNGGHSSMRAALIYQHRTADRDRVIADALNLLVERVEDLAGESRQGLVVGAGDENRTRVASLEDWGSTIELHPRPPRDKRREGSG